MPSSRYFVPGDSPVVIDNDGRTVGGGEWFEANQTAILKSLVDNGTLVRIASEQKSKYDGTGVEVNPDAIPDGPIVVQPGESDESDRAKARAKRTSNGKAN